MRAASRPCALSSTISHRRAISSEWLHRFQRASLPSRHLVAPIRAAGSGSTPTRARARRLPGPCSAGSPVPLLGSAGADASAEHPRRCPREARVCHRRRRMTRVRPSRHSTSSTTRTRTRRGAAWIFKAAFENTRRRSMSSYGGLICLACGGELPEPLRRTASLRCHDCRDLNAPLQLEHARWERAFRLRRSTFDSWASDPPEEPTAA